MQEEIAKFIEYLKLRGNSPHTIRSYAVDLKEFSESCRNKPVDRIGRDEIRNFLSVLARQKVERSSMNRKLSALRSFFKFLVEHGVVSQNPITIKAPKIESKLPSFLTKDKAGILMDIEGISVRDRAILEVLYGTGVRASELVGMNIGSVDFVNETVKVLGKRSKERIIPLTQTALSALKQYLIDRNKSDLSAPLFLNKFKTRLSQRSLQTIVGRHIRKVAELTRMSPHTLRHTYASVMLDNGCDLRTIQELLGHSSIASTQLYTHLTPEKLKEVYKHTHPRA